MDLDDLILAQRKEREEREKHEKLIRVSSHIISVFVLLMGLVGLWLLPTLLRWFYHLMFH